MRSSIITSILLANLSLQASHLEVPPSELQVFSGKLVEVQFDPERMEEAADEPVSCWPWTKKRVPTPARRLRGILEEHKSWTAQIPRTRCEDDQGTRAPCWYFALLHLGEHLGEREHLRRMRTSGWCSRARRSQAASSWRRFCCFRRCSI